MPGIKFDEEGISNYYFLMQRLKEAYPRGERGLMDWEAIVKKISNSGRGRKYDCVIGVSGGTDSSYLLWIAKEYGLKPLAVNLDNGWNSEIAVKNIRKLTAGLDIDLETYVIDYEEVKDLIRTYMKAGLPWIDIPTDLAIKSVLYRIASREGIRYILRGNDFRSEGTQPREWTYGDGRQLNYLHRKFGTLRLRTFPKYTIQDLLYFSVIRGIKSIYPFYYLDYSKNEAQKFLKEKFNWEYYGGHHYENLFTRFVISYWLFEKFGIDKRKITLSAQIVNGELSREDAINVVSEKPYSEAEKERFLEYVIKKLDLEEGDFEALFRKQGKTYLDYPSNYSLIEKSGYIAKFFMSMIFVHKPQSLFQAEMRKAE